MKRLVAATLLLACSGLAAASEAKVQPNPTGTWRMTTGSGDRAREMTFKLKWEGTRLTGAFVGRNGLERPIEDGWYQDGDIGFTIGNDWGGRKFSTRYTGKVSGDTMQGQAVSDRDGQARTRDWEAKRARK